ncbi:MAG: VOC family protein [Planctomycetes bacterium]|nr:VOC family protein [Planctomycetota bacterium]
MDFELDHVFVCVSMGGSPEAGRLASLGLAEGEPNQHPGQGTACRRFVFANAFLELLWVSDPDEVRAEQTCRLGLWERWVGRSVGACPFGVCLRPCRPEVRGLPFSAWPYQPSYLPDSLCFHVGMDSSSPEGPLLVYLPFGRRPDTRPEGQRQPLHHPIGFREITRVLVRAPRPLAPIAEEAAGRTVGLAFQEGEEHLLEVGFDGERSGVRADLRPLLPLLLLW